VISVALDFLERIEKISDDLLTKVKETQESVDKNIDKVNAKLTNLKLGFTIKKQISSTALISLMIMLVWYMHSLGLIKWLNMDDRGFQVVIWICFWTAITILGLKNNSIAALGMQIMQIWSESELTDSQKVALIMNVVQQWLGWVSDIGQLLNINKKK
jgi:hypothetical protein